MLALRYLDIVILILALPVFLAADLPMLGYAAAAVAWLVQRAVQIRLTRQAARAGGPRAGRGGPAPGRRGRGGLHDRTWMARSPYDLRRRDGGQRRGPGRRGARDRP